MTAVLAAKRVTRSFGPIEVLHGVDFDLRPGEIHALIGENGAGKSTMMKILGGYLSPTTGGLELDGTPVTFADQREAEAAGILMIHQEFNLALQLTVEENLFLGREKRRGPFLDSRAMMAEAREWLGRLECPVDPRARVADLSVPNRQMVEIARALGRNARVLIMDEPTAVLTGRETDVLLDQIERLKAQGTAILYTSHKLDEIARIADRVTVLRDGTHITTRQAQGFTEHAMAEAMVGRDLTDLYPAKPVPSEDIVLTVEGVTVPGHVRDASFTLRRGEVLGFAGLVGAGRTELMEGIAGLRPVTGQVAINGKPLKPGSVLAAREAGLVYLTEDRKEKGLLLGKDLTENLTLLALDRFGRVFIDKGAEARALTQATKEFDIRANDRTMLAGSLSGGNQQKLLLAKTMLAEPQIVIIDEPTRGIDIGTKQQIYDFIAALATTGKSVIVVSSELPEVIGLANRVMVMGRGHVAGELTGDQITEDAILRRAMGVGELSGDAA
ncbi:sugar ABC transporter ATP-binding protein [Ponticoccus alexandrii]|uniref:ATP-binding cassette domain-containing protein n=1 Tax=Ponticoccus alexandrii TaxID=1943633 RepID=A0ABX7FC09_9RHOB|nr:sugar ABC transporter ATP-binding protein [Ponticoccus alexandrii]ETA50846.1 ABC transporter ATP-binding protein [Rhodobacteraceae bacterium PD-2]QRF67396.1 ATP-binding cassette domain-containing protein [Ponticoccus alexandrii]